MTRIQIRQQPGWLMAHDGINSWNLKQPGRGHLPRQHVCSAPPAAVQLFISVTRQRRHMSLTLRPPHANKALSMFFVFFCLDELSIMLSELGWSLLITYVYNMTLFAMINKISVKTGFKKTPFWKTIFFVLMLLFSLLLRLFPGTVHCEFKDLIKPLFFGSLAPFSWTEKCLIASYLWTVLFSSRGSL